MHLNILLVSNQQSKTFSAPSRLIQHDDFFTSIKYGLTGLNGLNNTHKLCCNGEALPKPPARTKIGCCAKEGDKSMIERVAQYMQQHGMVSPGQKVLAGVSGGVDSVAMLQILCTLSGGMGFTLEAAHFNHGIRAESAEEERFVASLCERHGIALHTGCADVPSLANAAGVSLEVAAREARHRFFRQVMKETGAQRLALAHHMDDQAETVLLRLFRGAGALGLGGMAPLEESGIIRPLLGVRRSEIVNWCLEQGFPWREDSSNADTAIPRNWIRHDLLPAVRERLNPSVTAALCRTAELLREDERTLGALAEEAVNQSELADGSVSNSSIATEVALISCVDAAVSSIPADNSSVVEDIFSTS
jgi:tRNA(Ile)-lysidine synthetase-like protein